MGLDNFFQRPKSDERPEPAWPDFKVCGGMFSGSNGSFRGKVYQGFIQKVTGKILYEYQSPESVKEMAEKLTPYLDEDEENAELIKMFQFAAENDLELVPWY